MAFALPYHTPYWGFLCFVDEKNMPLIKECKSMVSFFPNHFALNIAIYGSVMVYPCLTIYIHLGILDFTMTYPKERQLKL